MPYSTQDSRLDFCHEHSRPSGAVWDGTDALSLMSAVEPVEQGLNRFPENNHVAGSSCEKVSHLAYEDLKVVKMWTHGLLVVWLILLRRIMVALVTRKSALDGAVKG